MNLNGEMLINMFLSASNNLENNKEEINRLNVFPVPDGDTGTNMSLTFSKATSEITLLGASTLIEILEKLSSASLRSARGNSGVILSQYIRGITKGAKSQREANIKSLAVALKTGTETAYQAVMKPTEGTILTVMRAISDKAAELSETVSDPVDFFDQVVTYGKKILRKTPEMLQKLKEANVVDAGGMGLIIMFDGLIHYIKTGEIISISDEKPANIEEMSAPGQYIEDITFGYCTEYLIVKEHRGVDMLRSKLKKIGDSVVVVEDGDVIKVHVHTDNPDTAIGLGLKLGSLINMKIDNMRYQNEQIKKAEEEKQKVKLKYAFIAVAAGDGFKKIYSDLGVNVTINGGQSMNPSTDDILNEAKAINAETIFVFPNNKNIILAAEQAAKLYSGKIIVIPTTSMAQVFPLMMLYDENADTKMLTEIFTEALKNVRTGQVTYAVRDSEMYGMTIKEGDIMGIDDQGYINISDNPEDCAAELIKTMTDENTEVITVYAGAEIKQESFESLQYSLEEQFPDCDVSLFRGEQPIYYYIVSAE